MLILFAAAVSMAAAPYDVTEKSIAVLQSDLATHRVTSEQLVRLYLARIKAIDVRGPALNSVIAINPDAPAIARALDAERKTKGARGPLHGIPILVKDNIETADPVPTTAGSLYLKDNITRRDAPAIARLRAAGAIILGKANLSEWANFRSLHGISGWSAVGGLVKNPYVLDRSVCGSSSGSGAAVAASLAAAAIGTETDGSLVCPGSLTGVVALKPTVGLVSRMHIVPIAQSQDTPGPMARSVADAALLLSVMAGSDPTDAATLEADTRKSDYFAALKNASLKGRRFGVAKRDPNAPTLTDSLMDKAFAVLKSAGAVIVEIDMPKIAHELGDTEFVVLQAEFKHGLADYFAGLPGDGERKSLAGAIAFNTSGSRELTLFGQEIFESAQKAPNITDPPYMEARDTLRNFSRHTLDGLFAKYHLDALIRATDDPAFRIDAVKGDNDSSNAAFLPATAGYPHLTVPAGHVNGLPVGLSFMGPAWSEAALLRLGAAFEKRAAARRRPTYLPSLESTEQMRSAFAPERR